MNPILESDFKKLLGLPLPWEELKGKHLFITGATGFIGGYITKGLAWLNHQLSLNLTLGLLHRSGTQPPFTDPCIEWISGDISANFIPEYFKPDIIIHAASPANRQVISSNPCDVISCNILATRYLLEVARKYQSCFLFFSSGDVYQRRPGRIMEKSAESLARDSLHTFYGDNKLAGELLCEQYREIYGVQSCILRPFSIFGPGESLASGRCFTDFARQALKIHRIQVHSSGTQIRSFCYLFDFMTGLLYVLLRGKSTVYNIGNEDNTCSILELAKTMAEICGSTEVIGPLSTNKEIDSFVPDTTRLRQLGWKPQVDLSACIQRCLDSYRYADSRTGWMPEM